MSLKDSLKNLLTTLNPAVLFLQETKQYTMGQIKLPNFSIFETNRIQNGGGGLITAVHEKLNPCLLETETENPDILLVQYKIGSNNVSLINGYGPQENDLISSKLEFFTCFEKAIKSSKLNGNLICAQLDANSKIGMENILSDPNHISSNGQLLMDIVERNGLIVVNSTDKCIGTITRVRKTDILEEKSVLDYFIVCPEFFNQVFSLVIDEERKYVLTKYSTRMGGKCMKESDHNPLVCTLIIQWDKRIKIDRKEIFKLKDKEGLRLFTEQTSNCPKLVEISQKSPNFADDAQKWMNAIQDIMHKSFKKVRITGKGKPLNPELETLMKGKQELRNKLSKMDGQNEDVEIQIRENIEIIEREISLICSQQNTKIVKQHIETLSNGEDQVCRLNMGRLKKQLCPRNNDPPMAKLDSHGNLVSNPAALKQLYADTYKHRLRNRVIKPGFEQIEILKNFLFNIRFSISKTRKSEPWTEAQLVKVLKSLKPGKSADALGYSNELFKLGVIGNDLFKSLLIIINRAKSEISIPRPVRLTKITSIYKQKGKKCDLENDRGV